MRESRHIALFATTLPVGGVPRMLVNVSKGLCDAGHTVDVVLCKKEGPFVEKLDPRVNVVNLGSMLTPLAIFRLAKYLRTAQPRALLATGLHRNVYAVCAWWLAGKKQRLVLSERVVVSRFWTNRHPMWLQKIFKGFYILFGKCAFPQVAAIHGVSREVTEDLRHMMKLPPEKLHVIYNPFINADLLKGKQEAITHPWQAQEGVKLVVSVGRLHPQKDYATLIRAFAEVYASLPEARLLILAEGYERLMLEALVKELRLEAVVQLPGFVNNPYAYMAAADVFVMSSLYEGLANVLVEALACGAPVVSTACPGGTEEILQGGRYGTIVPLSNAPQLAQAILAVLRDVAPARAKTQAFLQERGHEFTAETSVNGYMELLLHDR